MVVVLDFSGSGFCCCAVALALCGLSLRRGRLLSSAGAWLASSSPSSSSPSEEVGCGCAGSSSAAANEILSFCSAAAAAGLGERAEEEEAAGLEALLAADGPLTADAAAADAADAALSMTRLILCGVGGEDGVAVAFARRAEAFDGDGGGVRSGDSCGLRLEGPAWLLRLLSWGGICWLSLRAARLRVTTGKREGKEGRRTSLSVA